MRKVKTLALCALVVVGFGFAGAEDKREAERTAPVVSER